MDDYQLLRLLHILSATLLFGTGLGSAYYQWQAQRSADLSVMAAVSRHVVAADWLFTLPAIIVQPLTGIGMMHIRGYGFSESWIQVALALYVVAGMCWVPVVWLQIQIRNITEEARQRGQSPPLLYQRYMFFWFVLGWPAFVAVLAAFYLMIYKPSLW